MGVERPTASSVAFDAGVDSASFSAETPSFVSVVETPYTPIAANDHHQNHLVALLIASLTCDAADDFVLLTVSDAMVDAESITFCLAGN